ncbi:peptidase M24, structural domain-containing protein [Obelidium mucronatum]|nr:peptidase M24, structural domain-containing protein [Obelidium mucronatum]
MSATPATPKVEENENALVPDTVTKYQTAADIANKALTTVIAALVAGAKVNEVCKLGDAAILEGVKNVYKQKKDLVKGIAFPTCVSPGNVICHLAPLTQDACHRFQPCIELGAQIDGFAAMVAHTHVVGSSKAAPLPTVATETALRLLKPGKNNYEVTDAISKVAADFGVTPVQGMMSHQLLRNSVAGAESKRIILNPSDVQKKDCKKVDFEEAPGEGYPRTNETHRTTVFKKTEIQYALKTAAARATYSTIKKDFGAFPFAISNFEDESKAKLGLIECEKNGLVEPYRVCYEQEGEESVHVIVTVLLMANGPLKITGVAFDGEVVKSDKVVKDEEIKALLAQPVRNNKKKKKAAAAAASSEQ